MGRRHYRRQEPPPVVKVAVNGFVAVSAEVARELQLAAEERGQVPDASKWRRLSLAERRALREKQRSLFEGSAGA